MNTNVRAGRRARVALPMVLLAVLAGCQTQSSLTAQSMHCAPRDVTVVASAYSREGSATVWCATCKDRLYQCVSNAAKDRVICKEATEESRCR